MRIDAAPERVWEALLAQDLGASRVTQALLFLRGYGGRAFRKSSGTFPEKLVRFGFTLLDEVPERELVFGIAGKFWRYDGGLRPLVGRGAFVAFAEDGCVKAAGNLRVEPSQGGGSTFCTETRIATFGSAARRKFRLYWSLIGPFSGLLRKALLAGIRRRAEADAH